MSMRNENSAYVRYKKRCNHYIAMVKHNNNWIDRNEDSTIVRGMMLRQQLKMKNALDREWAAITMKG